MTLPLTERQLELLRFIESREMTPTFEEMAEAVGLKSKSGTHRLVLALEQRGFIRRIRGAARGIEVIRPSSPGIEPIARIVATWDGSAKDAVSILTDLRAKLVGVAA